MRKMHVKLTLPIDALGPIGGLNSQGAALLITSKLAAEQANEFFGGSARLPRQVIGVPVPSRVDDRSEAAYGVTMTSVRLASRLCFGDEHGCVALSPWPGTDQMLCLLHFERSRAVLSRSSRGRFRRFRACASCRSSRDARSHGYGHLQGQEHARSRAHVPSRVS